MCAHVVSHFPIFVLCFCLSLISFCHSARFFFCEPAAPMFSFSIAFFAAFSCNKSVLDGLVRLYIPNAPECTWYNVSVLAVYAFFPLTIHFFVRFVDVYYYACLLACLFVRSFVCLYAKVSGEICVCSWSAFKIDLYLNVNTWYLVVTVAKSQSTRNKRKILE